MRARKEMDKDDIRDGPAASTSTPAKRARDAGFDILYVYCVAHRALLASVPHCRSSTGGRTSTAARSRTVRASGARCSSRCARRSETTARSPSASASTRSTCSWARRGTQPSGDGLQFVEYMDELVDVWDINVSASPSGARTRPRRASTRTTSRRPWQKASRSIAKKPVLGVGRFTNPDTMVEAIRVGHARHHRHLPPVHRRPLPPAKIEEGRLDDIRECIGCNICISRWEIGGPPLVCTQNATSGEEYRRGWHPEKFEEAKNADNDVLVVGAGPGRDGVRDGARQARHAPRPPRRGRRRHGRRHALDPAAARPGRVGSRRQLPQDPDRQAQERRVHPQHEARRAGRPRLRRRDRRHRDRLVLGDGRPQRLHARHDPRR